MGKWVAGAARGSLVLGGLVVLSALTYLTAIRPAYVLAYAFCLLWALAWAWPRLASRGISLERTLAAGPAVVGESFQETFGLRKRGRVPAPWVEVSDGGDVPGYDPGRVVSLGGAPVTWTARGVYRRRGWATFGPTRLRVGEPFGLFARELVWESVDRVLVYPRIRRLPELMPVGGEPGDGGHLPGGWTDQPPETGGIREYAAGDAFGRIHWPLSQKHRRLMSRTFDQPRADDLWLVLDLDREAHRGQGEESTLEYGVSLAASVALQLQGRGRRVGLVANDARATVLEPHRVGDRGRMILDYLALVEADGRCDLGRSPVWQRLRRLPRRAIAVFTPSPPQRWIDALRWVGGRGTSMLAFWLDPLSFSVEGEAAASGSGPPGWVAAAVGGEIDLYVVRRGDGAGRLLRARDVAQPA
jgi:uncharacterized protein (DUF58 family)